MKNRPMHGATSFDALAAFARVAECRSFSEAARQLGVTPSALSHSLRQLEATLNLRLLHRTTRSVSPTEAGQMLLDRLTPALQDMRQTLHDVQSMGESPSGKLRLNVPRHTARMVLAPVLGAFHARCPNVELEIVTEDRMVDIVRDGFDAGIRFGERLANDMVAMPIRPVPRFLVVGTPGYFEKHGVPKTPEDLKSHLCINRRFSSGARYAWEFEKKGRALEVQVQGPLALDDDIVIMQAALAGIGLAYLYDSIVSNALASGALKCVLADWCPPTEGFYLYYPSRHHVPTALRILIELLQAEQAIPETRIPSPSI